MFTLGDLKGGICPILGVYFIAPQIKANILTFRHFTIIFSFVWVFTVFSAISSLAAVAEPSSGLGLQVMYLGPNPQGIQNENTPAEVSVLVLSDLPKAEEARGEVFAALLKSNLVSNFQTSIDAAANFSNQLTLVMDVEISEADGLAQITLGNEHFPLEEFSKRVSALVAVFSPEFRRIGFLRLSDPQGIVPSKLQPIRAMVDALTFEFTVVTVVEAASANICKAVEEANFTRDLLSGVADRTPFGNGDGNSSVFEVDGYLNAALTRLIRRNRDCGSMYNLIVKNDENLSGALIEHGNSTPYGGVEAKLYHETFEAMFLMKTTAEGDLNKFLESCEFCPLEAQLSDRLRGMRRAAVERQLENEVWERIKDDASPERLVIFAENCSLCELKDQALERIDKIEAILRVGEAEAEAFKAASAAMNLTSLRSYVTECEACVSAAKARELIAQIESNEKYHDETVTYQAAVEALSIGQTQAYLDNCEICEHKSAALDFLALREARDALLDPCMAVVGLPQMGGPRKLAQIDIALANQHCGTALASYDDDGLLLTLMGRVRQAEGNHSEASDYYAQGVAQQTPSAFGLTAFNLYAPGDGSLADPVQAEKMAVLGAERGDWLSKELLTVLYSKQLVAGKTAKDAYAIAEPLAQDGNSLAQFFTGFFLQSGTGVEVSPEMAAEWFQKSVDQDYLHSYSFLAGMLETGEGLVADPDRAVELYWDAMAKGDPTALQRLTLQLNSRSRDVVRIVQQRLRDEGYYKGRVDGLPGPTTVKAVNAWHSALASTSNG